MDGQGQDEQKSGNFEKGSPNYRYDPVPLKEDNEQNVKKLNFFQLYSGLLYAILSAIFQLIANIIARRLSHYHTSELIAYRVMVEIVFLLPVLIQQRIEFTFWAQAPLLLLRGALMSCTFFFRIFAIQSITLSESQPIIFSLPIVTAMLDRVFLKNRFTNVKISALVSNIIGLSLVCHFWTGFDPKRYLGIGSAFLFLLFAASSRIVLKKLTLDLAPKLLVFYVSCMRLVAMLSVTEMANDFSVPTIPDCPGSYRWYQSELVLIFLMGIVQLFDVTLDAEAVKLENPSTVVAIKTSISMPLAIVSQMIFFKNVPSVIVIVGVALVLMTSLLINLDSISEKLSPKSTIRIIVSRLNK